MEVARLKPRQQGDLGELSAMDWLTSKGANVFKPVFHSPNIDLVAEVEGGLIRVEVKTSSHRRNDRWGVLISTRGGNRSWSGLVKYFDPGRCDFLFVHVGDGRRWFIPTQALECSSGLTLGGPKYAEFEIEPGRALLIPELESGADPGGVPKRSTGAPCKGAGSAFAGSNPASPIKPPRAAPFRPNKFERKLGKGGCAVINQKRRVTLPNRAVVEAGLRNGDRLEVRADHPGRIVLEKAGLPLWAEPE